MVIMVMHEEKIDASEPQYVVAAKLCEPNYKAELKYLRAEMAFVERRLSAPSNVWSWLSIPTLGIFKREDWRKYHRTLDHYGKQLDEYAQSVKDGVLPVKFAVYNTSKRPDKRILVKVHAEEGRFDVKKQPPARPSRMDPAGHTGTKLSLVWPSGFLRRKILLDAHTVQAELSALEGHDGAVLVNQLVHVHCGPDTTVTYDLSSLNVAHESGEVVL